jgi:hypothetical protein
MSRGLKELRERRIGSGLGLSSLLRPFKTMITQRHGNLKGNSPYFASRSTFCVLTGFN